MFDQCDALCRNLAKKAQGATTQREKLEQKMEAAKLKGKGNKFSAKLIKARQNEEKLLKIAKDIKILLYWLRIDILSLAGPDWAERMELINFIIEELKLREDDAHKGIKKLRIALSNVNQRVSIHQCLLAEMDSALPATFRKVSPGERSSRIGNGINSQS